jgi:hypothetical protein
LPLRSVEGLALLAAGLPLAQFLGGLPGSWPRSFGDQRDHSGVDARHQPIGFLSLVVAHRQPAGATGDTGHFCAPLIEDQVKAGAQATPARLERRDAGIAAADFQGDGCGRERSSATAQIRFQQITPSIRGRPSAAAALAGNIWADAPWRAASLIAAGDTSTTLRS